MTAFDLRPLFHSSVGFDRVMDLLDARMGSQNKPSAYPPYNIIKTSEDHYRIVMAMAGFSRDQLKVVAQENNLLVKGETKQESPDTEYLHKGIAARSFEKTFQLADYIKVKNVHLKNGLLTLELEREVPEESKPRCIEIVDDASMDMDAGVKTVAAKKEKA